MTDRVEVREIRLHQFKGAFPKVETYSHVNTELLYQGDEKPFHITLPIAEVGRVSANGLLYDETLVGRIAEQVQNGVGGIRGHIPEGAEDFAFPVDEVHWIGHVQEDKLLWLKGYVPPGETRDDIRRKMARNSTIGTSIYGSAVKEMVQETVGGRKVWRAKDFDLEQVDLAPAKRASLKMDRGFTITAEMESPQEENTVTEVETIKEITLADVPSAVREQIIREAKVQADAARVTELETRITELEPLATRVAELQQTIETQNAAMTRIAETLNVPADQVLARVAELHTQVAELKKATFEAELDKAVAGAFADWQVIGEANKARLDGFRATVRQMAAAKLNGDVEKISETVTGLLDGDLKIIKETMRDALAGPAAIIGSNGRSTGPKLPSAEEIAQARALTGI